MDHLITEGPLHQLCGFSRLLESPVGGGPLSVHLYSSYSCKGQDLLPHNLPEQDPSLLVLVQRCGVKVIVLEGRDRVGGRVHTLQGQGFSSGVDLGASIITGVATNTGRGLRSDPSALLAK